MSDFDENYFCHLLSRCGSKQKYIQSASAYMYHHRSRHCSELVNLWKQRLFSENDPAQCLCLFYLLNEILLLSISKGKHDFVIAFGSLLPSIFDYISFKSDELKLLIKVNEIIDNWENLMIFSVQFLREASQQIKQKVRD